MGVYGIADPITTNQKVAGSSPAERASKYPANRVRKNVLRSPSTRPVR